MESFDWNSGENHQTERTISLRFKFDLDEDDCITDKILKKAFEKFVDAFPNKIPSSKLAYSGSVNYPTLQLLLIEKCSFIADLTLESVRLPNYENTLDINPFLGPNIIRLSITKPKNGRLILSLDELPNVKYLTLEGCDVHLKGKISPKLLKIAHEDNTFLYNNKNLESVAGRFLINDIIDFSEMEIFEMAGDIWKLDVSTTECRLKRLLLDKIVILGWSNSLWTTNWIQLGRKAIESKTEMSLASIPLSGNTLDISDLPLTVEKLFLISSVNSFPSLPPTVVFHDGLRDLSIQLLYPISQGAEVSCEYLENYVRTTDATLSNLVSSMCRLYGNLSIPGKTTKLFNVSLNHSLECQMELIIIQQLSFEEHLPKVNYKMFLFEFKQGTKDVDHLHYVKLIEFWKQSKFKSFALGPVVFSEGNPFLNSKFSNFVNQEGEYYLFVKGKKKGMQITYDKFSTLFGKPN